MLGLGVSEVIIILIVALVVLGPTKLPQVARQVGKGLREFRRAASDLQHTFDEVAREAEREERAAETKKLLGAPLDGEPVGAGGFALSDARGNAVATDASGRPILTDAHGHPIATDAQGHPVLTDAQGRPIALDAGGNPVSAGTAIAEPGSTSLASDAVASASGDVSSSVLPTTTPPDPSTK